ncbi:MAG TPA: GreA/GreB family elongation factor [Victivallales bacterium]|nr:GreA/GreB family elongation factor [Victivallales bacterium]
MSNRLDELCIKATESDNGKILDEIFSILSDTETITNDMQESLSLIIESWQEHPKDSPNKTEFILKLSSLLTTSFQLLRTILPSIIKKKLKPGVNKATAIKALGIRMNNVPFKQVYKRYLNIQVLESDKYYYNNASKSWGIVGDIDWITGSVSLLNFNKFKIHEVDLDSVLDHTYLFTPTDKILKLFKAKTAPTKSEAYSILDSFSVRPISKSSLKNILLEMFVPKFYTFDSFEKWWKSSDVKVDNGREENITLEKSRSIQELYNYVNSAGAKLELSDDAKIKASKILNLIRLGSSTKEFVMWAEIISRIFKFYNQKEIDLLIPEDDEVFETVWPESVSVEDIICIEIWTKLKAVHLPQWIKMTKEANGEDYLINILTSLPWKVWPSFTNELKLEKLDEIFSKLTRITNPETLLWIWKNKAKVRNENLSKLRYTNVFPAISRNKQGAIWQAAQKELKKLTLENAEFQKLILGDKEEADILGLIELLNNSLVFIPAEKQSIIVKISRLSKEIKNILESDKAKKLITHKQNKKTEKTKDEVYITSVKSFNEKLSELQNIINKELPENTRAIATAREHGDLRENAEFAAAKERQKFLNEHRALLEIRIATTQPTDFSDITVGDSVIVGSTTTLTYDNNKTETYYILGAWDSDPGKNYVSYETELGQSLVGQKLNTKVTLPNGTECKITKVSSLPEKIIKELTIE